jgi:hypothetical protein
MNREKWAQEAVEFVLPAVKALMESGTFSRKDLCIVIAQPGNPQAELAFSSWQLSGILYHHVMGERERDGHNFYELARKKAYLSWRYAMPLPHLQFQCPYLLGEEDTMNVGSASRDGLAVGVSGVQSHYCQMIAEWVLEALRGLAIDDAEKKRRARKEERERKTQDPSAEKTT